MPRKRIYPDNKTRQRAFRLRKKQTAFEKRSEELDRLLTAAPLILKEPIVSPKDPASIETEEQLLDYLDLFRHDDVCWQCGYCKTWTYFLYDYCRHCGDQMTAKQDEEREAFFLQHKEAEKFRIIVEARHTLYRIGLENNGGERT